MFSPECILFSSSFIYYVRYTAYHCVKHCLEKYERGDQGKFKWVVKNIATHILIGALAHLGNNSMQ